MVCFQKKSRLCFLRNLFLIMLVCASIDKSLREKEYVFDGKYMENMEYVACIMRNGLREQLCVSATNLFPIRCAFEKKLNEL